MGQKQKGGGSHKIGRHSDRSPSAKMYKLAQRWVINKAKRAKRNKRVMAKKSIRKIMRLPESQRDYTRLQELRHVVSQNMTG